jgi:hypothetical protein
MRSWVPRSNPTVMNSDSRVPESSSTPSAPYRASTSPTAVSTAHEHGRIVKVVDARYAFLVFAGRFAPRAVLRRMMERSLRPMSPIER